MTASPLPGGGTPDDTLPTLYTLRQVADLTGLGYWWLRRACANREIEFAKAGNGYRMTAAQVQLAIDAAKVLAVPRALPTLPATAPGVTPMDMSVPAGMEDIRDEILKERARRLAGRWRRQRPPSGDSTD